jgi:hypothetical protein
MSVHIDSGTFINNLITGIKPETGLRNPTVLSHLLLFIIVFYNMPLFFYSLKFYG